jgi:hypothetical protein
LALDHLCLFSRRVSWTCLLRVRGSGDHARLIIPSAIRRKTGASFTDFAPSKAI